MSKDSAAADDVVVRFAMSHTHFVKENDDWIFKLIGLKAVFIFPIIPDRKYNEGGNNFLKHFLTSNLKYEYCFSCTYFLFQL